MFPQTIENEGIIRGLYAGTIPSLAANIAENSILFAAYGACQKLVADNIGVAKGGVEFIFIHVQEYILSSSIIPRPFHLRKYNIIIVI